jgi:hypothetical protein
LDESAFWGLIELLDWSQSGDDELVIEPVVALLAAMPVTEIRALQEMLATKLHALDGAAWVRESGPDIWCGEPSFLSADGFLHARCVVVANGIDTAVSFETFANESLWQAPSTTD